MMSCWCAWTGSHRAKHSQEAGFLPRTVGIVTVAQLQQATKRRGSAHVLANDDTDPLPL